MVTSGTSKYVGAYVLIIIIVSLLQTIPRQSRQSHRTSEQALPGHQVGGGPPCVWVVIILTMFSSIFETGKFADCTVACEGREFRCHKNILAGR